MMKVAVVTPTVGSDYLQKCVDSVRDQSYEDLKHYVFVDGCVHQAAVEKVTGGYFNKDKIRHIILEENVGKGWYGHRVYSACSFLVDADIIVYLDEDNWIEENHVELLVDKIRTNNLDWAYSLRKIYDKSENFLCEDNCESLGRWPVFFNDSVYHIDTSSFAVKRDIATKIGHAWYGQWGADRQFFGALSKHFPRYDCTNSHTLCYRLDGNPNSVKQDFFDKGNAVNFEKYNGEFPWKQSVKRLSLLGDQVTLALY